MARRTKEEAEQTRRGLMEAALGLFAKQGVEQTSLKQVAAQAEVTHGALYWHFKNRTDLVAQLYREHPLPLDELYLEHLQAARQDALKALRHFMQEWVELVVTRPDLQQSWRVFYRGETSAELLALQPELLLERQQWLEWLHTLLKKARKQKQVVAKPKKGPDRAAANLLLLIGSLIAARVAEPAQCEDREQAAQIIDTYLRGMRR